MAKVIVEFRSGYGVPVEVDVPTGHVPIVDVKNDALFVIAGKTNANRPRAVFPLEIVRAAIVQPEV
jgi:hypothetical protein